MKRTYFTSVFTASETIWIQERACCCWSASCNSQSWCAAPGQCLRNFVLAFDIDGAFDRGRQKALMLKLKSVGIYGNVLSLRQDFICGGCFVSCRMEKHQSPPSTQAGVPQGSALGPLLWNLYKDHLLRLVPDSKAFADDLILSVSYAVDHW